MIWMLRINGTSSWTLARRFWATEPGNRAMLAFASPCLARLGMGLFSYGDASAGHSDAEPGRPSV